MPAKRKRLSIVVQLRAAIRKSDKTHYRLWKDSGVGVPIIGRFLSGERDITLSTAARLCAALNLELKPKS